MGEVDQVELTFPPHRAYLSLVRAAVGTIAKRMPGLDDARIEDLRLAVSEACANAIDAYTANEEPVADEQQVVVRFVATQDRVEVEVLDRAGGFDTADLSPNSPVTRPDLLEFERGLGIPLMRAVADEIEIRPHDEGTLVRLVVRARRRRGQPRHEVPGSRQGRRTPGAKR